MGLDGGQLTRFRLGVNFRPTWVHRFSAEVGHVAAAARVMPMPLGTEGSEGYGHAIGARPDGTGAAQVKPWPFDEGMGMSFWRALLRAFLHSIATLVATISVWAIWLGWFVFINGHHSVEWGGPWGVYRFGMQIAFVIALLLCGGFLTLSLVYHYFAVRISRRQRRLSSVTLALSSLALWPVLPEGGLPLIALLIGLPILAALWMTGGGGRALAGRAEDKYLDERA